MVGHIFKKDWRLLWPLVTALAVLQGLLAFARFTRFSAGQLVSSVPTTPMAFLELLAVATVITLAVHQDPIPGVRQDWLVRPISRRDLFLAKLLFVVALVQGPMFVTDLLQGLANGFSFGQSAAAAIACAASVLLTLTLPVLAFAALTASTTETLVAALGVFALVIASLIVPSLAGLTAPAALTGFSWVPSVVRQALLLAAAAGVLVLQYRWRRTWTARGLFAAALLVGQCVQFLPWRATLRLEQVLTASTEHERGIAVAFAPSEGRFLPAPGQGLDDVQEKPGMGAVDVAEENRRRRAEGAVTLFLPVRVSGLTANSRLLADRSSVTVIGRDGRAVYQGTGNELELRATAADVPVHQGIRVPGALYSRLKGERVDVDLEYSFTLFQPDATYALAARHGDQRMPGIGWCATKVNDAGNRVLFQCLQPGERPSCLAVVLEHAPTGRRNPEVSLCVPDYTPYPGHTFPDALSRFGGTLPFYDPSGLIRYPVGGSQLSEARVLVTAFQPAEHFTRRVVIRAVRLQDWEAQTP
jgi:hypothetical protein